MAALSVVPSVRPTLQVATRDTSRSWILLSVFSSLSSVADRAGDLGRIRSTNYGLHL